MLAEQEKKALRQKIQSNQHEVFVIPIEEMDAIVRSAPRSKIDDIRQAWQEIKGKAAVGASYYATADDLRTLSKLVGDLGGFTARAYIKTYGGKPHIILKGYPGLRNMLTGTKYGINNPKVVAMGLGKAGAIHAAKSGGILSVVLLTGYRVVDYFLTDEAVLSQLIGSLATDVVKVGIATGASIGAASLASATGITIAVGPIAAVIIVGVIVSIAIGALDAQYGITDRVIAGLDELSRKADHQIEKTGKDFRNSLNETAESIIDYAIDSASQMVINTAKHQLHRFLSARPRLY